MLERFGEVSGLKVNCQKVLWIGSLRGFDQIFCPEKKLQPVAKVLETLYRILA